MCENNKFIEVEKLFVKDGRTQKVLLHVSNIKGVYETIDGKGLFVDFYDKEPPMFVTNKFSDLSKILTNG